MSEIISGSTGFLGAIAPAVAGSARAVPLPLALHHGHFVLNTAIMTHVC